jgi:hypothetical protein
MKKPAIPGLQAVTDKGLLRVLTPMKENIEILNGLREGVIEKLPATTTDLPTIVAKINEIIARLNAHD